MDPSNAPFIEHVAELRKRLIICLLGLLVVFFGAFYFADLLFAVLTQPLLEAFTNTGNQDRRLIFTSLPEQFITQIKIAFYMAIFVGCPLFLTQIWMFMAPGLYHKEQRLVLPFFLMTPVMFILGMLFVYYAVIPSAWAFFVGFEVASLPQQEATLPIELEPKVSEYLSLVLRLMLAFGLAFEVPLVLVVLVVLGVLQQQTLKRWRKGAIVVAFVAAAILTPPDPLSQIALALPLIVFYELSILVSGWIVRYRAKK